VQGWLRDHTPRLGSPGRAHRRRRVHHGSSLYFCVRPFTVAPSWISRLVWPLLTSARSRPALPQGALSRIGGRVRWSLHAFRHGPQSGSRGLSRPHARQISPNKNLTVSSGKKRDVRSTPEGGAPWKVRIHCQCTTAAFTLSPVPGGLRHLVLTRPETEPSIRFLSVGSHLCARASFRPPLAGLPLPSASSCICPTIGHYRYSYRGLHPISSCPCRAYTTGSSGRSSRCALGPPLNLGVGRRAAPGPRPLEREMSMDRITRLDNRDRDGTNRAPTNGARVVSRQVVRRCAPSNSRSSGTAALRLRLRPYDSVERLRLSPSSRGAAQLALR
jgi:hypothetical protein